MAEAVAYMREQVMQMNARIRTAMLEVSEINAQNERLRQENLALEQRLRQKLEKQVATPRTIPEIAARLEPWLG
jgi:regulator of replication initiation timing